VVVSKRTEDDVEAIVKENRRDREMKIDLSSSSSSSFSVFFFVLIESYLRVQTPRELLKIRHYAVIQVEREGERRDSL
jgi:hypothetical protein